MIENERRRGLRRRAFVCHTSVAARAGTVVLAALAAICVFAGTASASSGSGRVSVANVEPSQWSDVFHIVLTCTGPSNTYDLTIVGNDTGTQSDIPAGSTCSVTSVTVDGHGRWWKPTISPSSIDVVDGQTSTITVTNNPAPGYITIKNTAPAGSTDTFPFTAACTNPTGTFTLSIVGTGEDTMRLIPATSICNLTEQVPAGYAQPTFDPAGPIDFHADRSIVVRVANTRLSSPPPPTTPPTTVKGVTKTKTKVLGVTLARTGTSASVLLTLAVLCLILGLSLRVAARVEAATAGQAERSTHRRPLFWVPRRRRRDAYIRFTTGPPGPGP